MFVILASNPHLQFHLQHSMLYYIDISNELPLCWFIHKKGINRNGTREFAYGMISSNGFSFLSEESFYNILLFELLTHEYCG